MLQLSELKIFSLTPKEHFIGWRGRFRSWVLQYIIIVHQAILWWTFPSLFQPQCCLTSLSSAVSSIFVWHDAQNSIQDTGMQHSTHTQNKIISLIKEIVLLKIKNLSSFCQSKSMWLSFLEFESHMGLERHWLVNKRRQNNSFPFSITIALTIASKSEYIFYKTQFN